MPTLLLLANPEAQPGRERLRHLEAHYKISHTLNFTIDKALAAISECHPSTQKAEGYPRPLRCVSVSYLLIYRTGCQGLYHFQRYLFSPNQ
jgi:hypothetical protein